MEPITGLDQYKSHQPERISPSHAFYVNSMRPSEQAKVCEEYLDYTDGWGRYREAKAKMGVSITAYCEGLASFWQHMEDAV